MIHATQLIKATTGGNKFTNFVGDYKAMRYAGATVKQAIKFAQKNAKKS